MSAARKIDWLIPLFFGFVLVAILPPVILFTLFKPFGASILSSGWLALMAFALVMFVWARTRMRAGTPAAAILQASMGLVAQNDRVLAGDVDGVGVQVVWGSAITRIDVRVGKRHEHDLDEWWSGLSAEQRVAMFDAVGDAELEIVADELRMTTPLSFRVPEHGAELEYRVRDAVRIAKALTVRGAPPKGAIERIREERRKSATTSSGALAIASPDASQGALSEAAGEGNVSLAAKKQPL